MSQDDQNDPARPLLSTTKEDTDANTQGKLASSTKISLRKRIHKFITAKTAAGIFYEEFMTLLVWLVILAYIMLTVPEYEKYKTEADTFGFVSMILFAIEWLIRFYSAPEDKQYAHSRWTFFFSFFSFIDLLTIVPYLVLVASWNHHESGTQFLRLLRLFTRFGDGKGCGEAWVVVKTVCRKSKWLLLSTAYFLLALWFVIAGCYHISERNNEKVNGRFSTLLGSMWWTLINLLGEYPLSQELSTWGKVVGTVTMVVAIGGVHGIPTGILSDGYAQHTSDERNTDDDDDESDDEDLLPLVELELKSSGVKIDSDRALDKLYLFINAYTPAGQIVEGAVLVLVIVNVFATMLDTVQSVHDDTIWKSWYAIVEPVSVGIFTAEYLVRLYAVGAHKRYRGLGRLRWAVTTFFSVVDLIAIVPFYVDLFLPGDQIFPTTFVRAMRLFRVFRVFKAGKFVEGMNVFSAVLTDKAGLLGMLMYGVGILWVIFSVLMFYAEHQNPIKSVAEQFNTVPRAMWMTLLNFTGEYPIGDYTHTGRMISTCVAFVAIAIFGIPVAIFSDGIAEKLEKLDEIKANNNIDEEEDEQMTEGWQDEANETCMGQFFLFMQGQDLQEGDTTVEEPWWEIWGVRFEFTILGLIMVNTVCFIMRTLPEFKDGHFDTLFNMLEFVSVIVYTVEYFLRLVSTYGDPRLGGVWYSPFNFLGYMFSFFGIIDIIALSPWYISHIVSDVSRNLVMLRSLRLFRLLRMERYLPAFSIFQDVLKRKFYSLVASVFIMLVCTIVCAHLLHYTEKDNYEKSGVTHYTMAYRFRSVPSSLFYTFIHLTGDYPLFKYSPWGRFINFFMIILAQGLVGIPLGIIVQGFDDVMRDKMGNAKKKQKLDMMKYNNTEWFDPGLVDKVEGGALSSAEGGHSGAGSGRRTSPLPAGDQMHSACFSSCRPSRRQRHAEHAWVMEGLVYCGEGDGVDSSQHVGVGIGSGHVTTEQAKEEDTTEEAKEDVKTSIPQQMAVFAAFNYSPIFDQIQMLMILFGMVGIIAQTDPSMHDTTGGQINTGIQYVVASFFLLEYFLRLYACPVDPKFRGDNEYTGTNWKNWKKFPRFCYATDFVGIIDLFAWLPFFIAQGLSVNSEWAVVCRMLQILLVLKFDRRLPAFTLLDDVLAKDYVADDDEDDDESDETPDASNGASIGRLLLCMAALSCILWVVFASLLYIIEKDQPEQDGSFKSMPASLFITMIFIGGEWCRVDLVEPQGEIVGTLLALVGIGIIGIPIAVFFDGYSELSEEYADKYLSPSDEYADKSASPSDEALQPKAWKSPRLSPKHQTESEAEE